METKENKAKVNRRKLMVNRIAKDGPEDAGTNTISDTSKRYEETNSESEQFTNVTSEGYTTDVGEVSEEAQRIAEITKENKHAKEESPRVVITGTEIKTAIKYALPLEENAASAGVSERTDNQQISAERGERCNEEIVESREGRDSLVPPFIETDNEELAWRGSIDGSDKGTKRSKDTDKTKPEKIKSKTEKDIEEHFTNIGFNKNKPFTEQEIQEFEADLEIENKTPKERILFVPANRFSNFSYHSQLDTYVPFTVDLSNMSLLKLDGIEFMFFVSYVNASNNLLTEDGLAYISGLEDLIVLILERNKIAVLNIPTISSLMLLDVSRNEMTGIHSGFMQPNLETLILNYNKLNDISKLSHDFLPKLKFLSLKANLIRDLDLTWPKHLLHLYLAENEISDPRGLTGLCQLKTLHLRSNRITVLKDFPKDLLSLEYLNLRSNEIYETFEVRRLMNLPNLKILIILGNPCTFQSEAEENYRLIVISALPNLERLDKKKISREERERALQLNYIFGDNDNDIWPFRFVYNEEGEQEVEIEVESPLDYTETQRPSENT